MIDQGSLKEVTFKPDPELSGIREVPDVVCPGCFQSINYANLYGPSPVDGRTLRSYMGWCFHCDKGYTVIQYRQKSCRPGRDVDWVIHEYLGYTLHNNTPTMDTNWMKVNALPPVESPVILTGPGGEYAKAISDEQMAALLQTTTLAYNKLANVLMSIIDILKQRKHAK